MKVIPLNYYINLFITEKCIEHYKLYNKKVKVSDYFSWFSYLETYIRGNSKQPDKVKELIWVLNKALAEMYGFNPDKAMECIINYFINNDYNKYLNFVTYRDMCLEQKN